MACRWASRWCCWRHPFGLRLHHLPKSLKRRARPHIPDSTVAMVNSTVAERLGAGRNEAKERFFEAGFLLALCSVRKKEPTVDNVHSSGIVLRRALFVNLVLFTSFFSQFALQNWRFFVGNSENDWLEYLFSSNSIGVNRNKSNRPFVGYNKEI